MRGRDAGDLSERVARGGASSFVQFEGDDDGEVVLVKGTGHGQLAGQLWRYGAGRGCQEDIKGKQERTKVMSVVFFLVMSLRLP